MVRIAFVCVLALVLVAGIGTRHVDADIVEIPPDTLGKLVDKIVNGFNGQAVDIIAPYVFIASGGNWAKGRGKEQFYDTWGFRFLNEKDDVHDISVYPQKAALVGPDDLIEMRTIGSCWLFKADIIRNGILFALDPEACVGWCRRAHKAGYRVWSYPSIRCLHSWEAIMKKIRNEF